jgi:hypothetical protein
MYKSVSLQPCEDVERIERFPLDEIERLVPYYGLVDREV